MTHRSARASLAQLALLLALAGPGCLAPASERAERDLEVGKAKSGDSSVVVTDGLAVIREFSAGEVSLWAGAPVVHVQLDTAQDAPAEWSLDVRNVLRDATVTVATSDGSAVATLVERPRVTRARFRLRLPAGARTSITIAPPDRDDPSAWTFALLSDVQEAIDEVQDVFSKIDATPSVRFLLGAGDLTRRGSAEELRRFQRELESLDVPYYTTLGNHELGESPAPWHEHFGRASFRFVYRGVQFTLLDSGSATIDPLVYEWLDAWLDEGRDHAHVVAMHIPPVDPFGIRNGSFASRNEAAKLLRRLALGRVDVTLYGHIHSQYSFDNAGIPAHISGGGGAIPERFDGIGRHFMTFEVSASGVHRTGVVRVD